MLEAFLRAVAPPAKRGPPESEVDASKRLCMETPAPIPNQNPWLEGVPPEDVVGMDDVHA